VCSARARERTVRQRGVRGQPGHTHTDVLESLGRWANSTAGRCRRRRSGVDGEGDGTRGEGPGCVRCSGSEPPTEPNNCFDSLFLLRWYFCFFFGYERCYVFYVRRCCFGRDCCDTLYSWWRRRTLHMRVNKTKNRIVNVQFTNFTRFSQCKIVKIRIVFTRCVLFL